MLFSQAFIYHIVNIIQKNVVDNNYKATSMIKTMLKDVVVKGARQHNLKNIDVCIPRNKLTVITGLSGSGKSSLAFDTIYAEGQRRYVESLSSYARQFLGIMQKPDLDSIEGLSPAISIEQKTTSKNPRSTVGTVTEIYDYLRLLYARIGTAYCPKCQEQIKPVSAETITERIMANQDKNLIILAPMIRGKKGTHEAVFEELTKDGFNRVRVNSKIYKLDNIKHEITLGRYETHYIEAVIDRLKIKSSSKRRVAEAVEHALTKGKGTMIVLDIDKRADVESTKKVQGAGETVYTNYGACQKHPDITFEELQPRMFSFNSPHGACENCSGIGERMEVDPELLIPNTALSIMDGAISVYSKMDIKWRAQQITVVGKKYKFDVWTPINKFTKKQLDILLYGSNDTFSARWSNGAHMNFEEGWEGIIPQTMRLYRSTSSEYRKKKIEKYMRSLPCHSCKGDRLKPKMLSVHVNKKNIVEVTKLSIEEALEFFERLPQKLSDTDNFIAKQVLKEISDRLQFLVNVGLGYLNLSRTARTLSGGEAQRIRLATQIGANLMGVLYVLDEPSIGLHQRDNEKLIKTLHKLRDLGNTVLVVEHDEDTMKASDYIIDLGPGAGVHGGNIVAQGTPQEIMANEQSMTGAYLRGAKMIETPPSRRKSPENISIKGCQQNNLQNVSVDLPTKVLCSITGVSGSGKSSLMNQTLMPALRKKLGLNHGKIGVHKKVDVPTDVRSVVIIDQEPIGRTPRSNPATYVKMFDNIRTLFASTKEAKRRGYRPGRFSFNVQGGRCEMCTGDGLICIEMNFLPDVYVQCEDCNGKRYNKDTLEILYKEKTIADILNMTVEDALTFFEHHRSIHRKVQTLYDVGLGYLTLGQSATTLSGGESQRIKLTRELAKVKKGHTVYLLDEPTTGLHFEDTRKLLEVLNRLVDKGNTVYVIEHNLDVVKNSDYVIDLGPEGGKNGGTIIAEGTPEEIMLTDTYTGQFLRKQ